MSTLIVTLSAPGSSSQELAYCLASNAHTVSSHGTAPLALLPRADDTVLLLPSAALSWHSVNLPKLSRSASAQKMRTLLDGVIEEQLLDDTSTLHIAHYRPKTGTSSWLAVCDKEWLVQQLRSVQAAGRRVSRIVPDAFPLAVQAVGASANDAAVAQAHVSGSPEAPVVTLRDANGVLTVPLSQARAAWPAPEGEGALAISTEPAVAAAAEQVFNTKIAIVQGAQRALQASLDAQLHGVDLAQGELAVTGSGRWLQQARTVLRDLLSAPAWQAARVGLAIVVLAQLVGLNLWAWKEQSSLQAKRQQSASLLTQTFPKVKVVVDAPVQMQRELGALRQASGALGNRDLESMLSRLAGSAPAAIAPTAIDYVAGEVTLKGVGLDAAQLEATQAKLRNLGVVARSTDGRLVLSEAANQPAGVAP